MRLAGQASGRKRSLRSTAALGESSARERAAGARLAGVPPGAGVVREQRRRRRVLRGGAREHRGVTHGRGDQPRHRHVRVVVVREWTRAPPETGRRIRRIRRIRRRKVAERVGAQRYVRRRRANAVAVVVFRFLAVSNPLQTRAKRERRVGHLDFDRARERSSAITLRVERLERGFGNPERVRRVRRAGRAAEGVVRFRSAARLFRVFRVAARAGCRRIANGVRRDRRGAVEPARGGHRRLAHDWPRRELQSSAATRRRRRVRRPRAGRRARVGD